MKPVLVLYATREGQTQRIARHLAATLEGAGLTAEILDAAHLPAEFSAAGFSPAGYSAAILAASVHGARHEREIVEFVKRHLDTLNRIPTVFISVSLSEAGAEDQTAPAERREQAAADARRMIDAFVQETGWHPTQIKPVAGALLYTQYNFLVRFVMKRIARKAGASTDTSADHEYTGWQALDDFVGEFIRLIPRDPPA